MSRFIFFLLAPAFLLLSCSYAPSGSYRDYQIREISLEVDALSEKNMCSSFEDGENQIPYASWKDAPDGVASFILFMESSMDPPTSSWDCSAENGKCTHLVMYNIPSTASDYASQNDFAVQGAQSASVSLGASKNTTGYYNYVGACSSESVEYTFTLIALNAKFPFSGLYETQEQKKWDPETFIKVYENLVMYNQELQDYEKAVFTLKF